MEYSIPILNQTPLVIDLDEITETILRRVAREANQNLQEYLQKIFSEKLQPRTIQIFKPG